ncbi:hypothetical protein PVL29_003596 [Vitis rotundifolia]|uniref:Uncharacterized protein n=1 Tax=Vitis rotundifolia TaxID=103349 RepID=A0AA39ADJ1_VITRO|nr:hypothetical protein PVL29_003596 [Vitis rotundifolia]
MHVRIPFWPCIKLMLICWLMIPHFDGSYYVYQHLVHPGLSMDPQVVMNRRFNESKKLYHSRENFLVAADRYIKENGAEALEKLLASKLRSTKPNVEVKEIKAPAEPEKKGEQVKQTEINLGETKSNTTCAAEIKERAAEIEACLHKKVQKEWACAVCQVTTQSEATLNSHLQGKRHKATSKQLKAKKQATKISGSPPVSMAKKSDQSTKEEQPKCTSNSLKSKNNGISAASTVKNPDETRDDERQKCGSSNGPNQKNNKKQEEKALIPETSEEGHQNLKQNGDGMKELGTRCIICYVSCTSELDMTSHLNGRRHFNRIKQLSELWCSNCNVKCNSEADMASHRNGRRHLKQLKKQSELWCSICSVSCNSKVDMNSHLNGRRHLDHIKIKETVRIMMPHILRQIARRMAWHIQRSMQGNLICNVPHFQVKQTEINLGETKSNTTCAAEIKERAAEIEACLHKKVQKEWACAVCQVTTQSKATLNSHLQGKRHKATSKQLKAKKQATKISGSPPVSMATKFDQSTKEEQLKCTSNNLKSKNNGISAASTVKNPDETRDDERQKCGSSNGSNEKNNKKQEEKALVLETSEQGHQNLKQNGDGMKELGSQCNICHVSCKSELDMTSHLNGRRHFNRIKQLSELWCSNCNVKCNSEADMASHRNGRRHLEQLMKWSGLWCSICSVSCNSKVNMNSHINGRRQLDQIKETVRIMMPRIVARAVACVVAHAGQSNLQ